VKRAEEMEETDNIALRAQYEEVMRKAKFDHH
jgi:hypothetical protein